jgi:methionine aminopeptidase
VVREFCGHGIGRKFHEDPRCCTTGGRERRSAWSRA